LWRASKGVELVDIVILVFICPSAVVDAVIGESAKLPRCFGAEDAAVFDDLTRNEIDNVVFVYASRVFLC
jgi:hypothetical protein